MATPRSLLVDPASSGVFHCISRCVRRAFLCGEDRFSGQSFEHRRLWIQQRLQELAGLFAIEVLAYAVMSNHLHLVVRTLPEQVGSWDDVEVARRWLWLFPGPGGKRGRPPDRSAILALCGDAEKLAICRTRLADLSWFMRCLNEPIARRANREDKCTGRFWEGRFKCQRLEDEGAILACMTYVDLNPVRAGLAPTPEQSSFTSAQDRFTGLQARRCVASAPEDPTPEQRERIQRAKIDSCRDDWLAPLGSSSRESSDGEAAGMDLEPVFTQLSDEAYLELLDWTGRQVRSEQGEALSPELRPILERLDLDVEAWVKNVERYGGLFHRMAGKMRHLRAFAAATGLAWLHGRRGACQLYARAA